MFCIFWTCLALILQSFRDLKKKKLYFFLVGLSSQAIFVIHSLYFLCCQLLTSCNLPEFPQNSHIPVLWRWSMWIWNALEWFMSLTVWKYSEEFSELLVKSSLLKAAELTPLCSLKKKEESQTRRPRRLAPPKLWPNSCAKMSQAFCVLVSSVTPGTLKDAKSKQQQTRRVPGAFWKEPVNKPTKALVQGTGII